MKIEAYMEVCLVCSEGTTVRRGTCMIIVMHPVESFWIFFLGFILFYFHAVFSISFSHFASIFPH